MHNSAEIWVDYIDLGAILFLDDQKNHGSGRVYPFSR